jgi:WD40 repeat protein
MALALRSPHLISLDSPQRGGYAEPIARIREKSPMTARCLATAAACLILTGAATAADARADRFGDPLPPGVTARMGTVRMRHGGDVWFVGFLSDSKTILSIAKDDALRWWEAASGRQLSSWSADSSILSCASLSADRKVLAARAGNDVIVWDALSGQQLRKLEKPEPNLVGTACSRDGKFVATCGEYIRLWDARSGARIRDFDRAADSYSAVALYPDSTTLVSTGRDGVVRWWDVNSGKVVHEANAHKGGGLLVEASPDGKRLATCGVDKALRVWDAVERTEQCTFAVPTPQPEPLCVAFSPNGKRLAACTEDGIRLYDVEAGRELWHCPGHQGYCDAVAFSVDGAVLVSGGADGAVRQWDAATGQEIRRFAGSCGVVTALAVSLDGGVVASAGVDRRVHIWDAATGEERRALAGAEEDQFHLLAFAPDGKKLVAAGRGIDRSLVRVWDVPGGTERNAFYPAKGYAAFAVSPDAAMVAAASGRGRFAFLDASTGEILREYTERVEASLDQGPFVRDGKALAFLRHPHGPCSRADAIVFWDVTTGGRELLALRGDIGNVGDSVACPDGKVLAAAGAGGQICLLNASTGEVIRTWNAGKDFILATAFSPDGRTLATSELDGSISLWETASGERRGLFRGGQGFIDALAFSPKGDRLYSGGHDGTVLAWDLTGRNGEAAAADLDDRSLEQLWDDLGGADAGRAYRAVWALAAAPGRSAPFLKAKLNRPAATPARIARWIGELDDDDLETRWQASAQLRSADVAAETALSAALNAGPSPEARRRIDELLAWIQKARTTTHPPDTRVVRAVEALEDAATPAAREALAGLAEGPETSLTWEAKASLERLRRRASP